MLDTATPRRIEEYDGGVISRISDYNSNTYEKDDAGNMCNIDEGNLSYVSSILSQDVDFIQDSSDYQWFADYRYGVVFLRDIESTMMNNFINALLRACVLCISATVLSWLIYLRFFLFRFMCVMIQLPRR